MKRFLDNDFELNSNEARLLYHNYASKMPIVDFHCHISPEKIASDYEFKDITELWLGGDHYKWRLMRLNGVDEKFITGESSSEKKFFEWARTLPKCIGNPIYHWSHLELKRYFDINEQINEKSAEWIYKKCNEKLINAFSVRKIIKDSNVEIICTTDDPCDTLQYHKQLREDKSFDVKVYPSFRPDNALNINAKGFTAYIRKLEETSNTLITSFDALCGAIQKRLDFFCDFGCRISDHALEDCIYKEATNDELDKILMAALNGQKVSKDVEEQFKTSLLLYLAKEYKKRGITMQIHFGCIRNLNEKMFCRLGPDTGFDGINNTFGAKKLARFLDVLDIKDQLPKTILYSLNENDNEWLATLCACHTERSIRSKVQIGSAWWFNDTKAGMIKQLRDSANIGVLGNFVGMVTDSRSFLSYTRHEYFRRILCDFIGDMIQNGEHDNDMEQTGSLIQDICYKNAKAYFNF